MDADKLKKLLAERGMTQTELARRTGLSTSYVSNLVNGERGRRIGHVAYRRICQALDVGPLYFLPVQSRKTDSQSAAVDSRSEI